LGYLTNIQTAISTSFTGLRLTIGHFFQARKSRKQDVTQSDYFDSDEGSSTLQFPHQSIPVPDNGRYKLHNEIDDCIVCDKCAKVCPVNCIDIVPIRSAEAFGETSDGTPKRIYAETFDIDMGKCMFCGLCTTVCPTECLTMTSEYDYSTFDIKEHLFPFGNMTEAEVEDKQNAWDNHQAQKSVTASTEAKSSKPVIKPSVPIKNDGAAVVKPKPVFKPRVMIPKPKKSDD
jgi:formate hydrogenlyase subunit 6/NADH:ubiquinone oxidoreductase subunit I